MLSKVGVLKEQLPLPTALNKTNRVYFSLCGDSKILVLACFLVG
ncbi:hypothetical protein PPAR_a1054 [Pseudoalteromonas paragorgicola KMM 3548]|nr:hypothetical protein [Pseudoalteromonas distincta KMM 3548]